MPSTYNLERSHPLINLDNEKPIRLCELANQLQLEYSTIWRWCQYGVPGNVPQEERTRLATVQVAGVRHTTLEAYKRFLKEQNGVAE